MLRDLVKIARPHQWTKNLFIFVPLFFAFNIYGIWGIDYHIAVGAFVGFSLVCSGVYCLNDIVDRDYDRLHPTKQNRPIASGRVSVVVGFIFMCILMLGGGALLMSLSPHGVFIPIILYVIINILYSFWLKNIAIIDVFVIACGFVLRLWIGAICFDISLSHWIVVVTFLLALFLALAKRRDDCILLERSGHKMRQNIESYNRVFLDVAMSVSASIVMVAYIFYSIDEEVIQRFGTDKLYFTSIFVLLGIFRYLQITFVYKRSSSPSKILLKDRFLQMSILAWLICFVGLVYFKA